MRRFARLGFLDIDWRNYDFKKHLAAASQAKPFLTVAQDVTDRAKLAMILEQAHELQRFCQYVVIVPKDITLADELDEVIPDSFLLGYSVPTRYGGTLIPPEKFKRPVHLLGGRPDLQRELARRMPAVSLDCNRFTYDASFGDHFDGETFRPHPEGGYERCIASSLKNINLIWSDYQNVNGKNNGYLLQEAYQEWERTASAQNV